MVSTACEKVLKGSHLQKYNSDVEAIFEERSGAKVVSDKNGVLWAVGGG